MKLFNWGIVVGVLVMCAGCGQLTRLTGDNGTSSTHPSTLDGLDKVQWLAEAQARRFVRISAITDSPTPIVLETGASPLYGSINYYDSSNRELDSEPLGIVQSIRTISLSSNTPFEQLITLYQCPNDATFAVITIGYSVDSQWVTEAVRVGFAD